MSWTVPVPEAGSVERRLLSEALDRADKSAALMFCSSPDNGKFTARDYPTAHNRERFFRIGAANREGTVFSWAEPIDKLDFILPGVDVVDGQVAKRLADRLKEVRSETGSSVATALAAGLAATIIYCFKACALAMITNNGSTVASTGKVPGIGGGGGGGGDEHGHNDNGNRHALLKIPPGEAVKIAEHANMKAAFGKLGTLTDQRFIQIWESLDSVNNDFKDDFADQATKLDSLVRFVTKLRAW